MATTNSNFSMPPGRIHGVTVSLDADSAVADEVDPGLAGDKRALVLNFSVNGQACVMLVRLQTATNGLFVDLVVDQSLAALDTRVGAMNLSGRSHPAPQEDAIDTTILVAAAD